MAEPVESGADKAASASRHIRVASGASPVRAHAQPATGGQRDDATVREYGDVSTVGVGRTRGAAAARAATWPRGTYTYVLRRLPRDDGSHALAAADGSDDELSKLPSTVIVVWEVALVDGRRQLTVRSCVQLRNCCGMSVELGCWREAVAHNAVEEASELIGEVPPSWTTVCAPGTTVSLPVPLAYRSVVAVRPAPAETLAESEFGWSSIVIGTDGSVNPHVACTRVAPLPPPLPAAEEPSRETTAGLVEETRAWFAVTYSVRGDESGVFPYLQRRHEAALHPARRRRRRRRLVRVARRPALRCHPGRRDSVRSPKNGRRGAKRRARC